jgi:hypothetical protein
MIRATLAALLLALPVSAPTPHAVLGRMAVVGASVSAGFHLDGVETAPLALTLEQALLAEHEAATSHASTFFFLASTDGRADQVEAALAAEPTLVVALDYLFWFAYGVAASEDARLAEFDEGLAILACVKQPLLVGDIPDVSRAAEGPMLSRSQVPAPETLVRLNERLAEWAAERPNVMLVPLRGFIDKATRGEAFELRGNRYDADALDALFQPDQLHASLTGIVGLTLLTLDALERASDDVAAADVRWSAADVLDRVRAARAAAAKD